MLIVCLQIKSSTTPVKKLKNLLVTKCCSHVCCGLPLLIGIVDIDCPGNYRALDLAAVTLLGRLDEVGQSLLASLCGLCGYFLRFRCWVLLGRSFRLASHNARAARVGVRDFVIDAGGVLFRPCFHPHCEHTLSVLVKGEGQQ